eukprot:6206858-Pleurochrysis_carterae.AAC.3
MPISNQTRTQHCALPAVQVVSAVSISASSSGTFHNATLHPKLSLRQVHTNRLVVETAYAADRVQAFQRATVSASLRPLLNTVSGTHHLLAAALL